MILSCILPGALRRRTCEIYLRVDLCLSSNVNTAEQSEFDGQCISSNSSA